MYVRMYRYEKREESYTFYIPSLGMAQMPRPYTPNPTQLFRHFRWYEVTALQGAVTRYSHSMCTNISFLWLSLFGYFILLCAWSFLLILKGNWPRDSEEEERQRTTIKISIWNTITLSVSLYIKYEIRETIKTINITFEENHRKGGNFITLAFWEALPKIDQRYNFSVEELNLMLQTSLCSKKKLI